VIYAQCTMRLRMAPSSLPNSKMTSRRMMASVADGLADGKGVGRRYGMRAGLDGWGTTWAGALPFRSLIAALFRRVSMAGLRFHQHPSNAVLLKEVGYRCEDGVAERRRVLIQLRTKAMPIRSSHTGPGRPLPRKCRKGDVGESNCAYPNHHLIGAIPSVPASVKNVGRPTVWLSVVRLDTNLVHGDLER
jgi:hypothetical protein